VSRINPDDVFPARNLPGEAEKWGRSIEEEVKKLREQQEITNQLLSGQNRGSASSLSNLSDQIGDINAILGRLVTVLPLSVATLGSFGVTTSYAVKNTASVTVPEGYTRALISVVGWISAYNNTANSEYLYAVMSTDAGYGESSYATNGASGSESVTVGLSTTLSGLTVGGIISTYISAKSGIGTWDAIGSNKASIQGFALFYN